MSAFTTSPLALAFKSLRITRDDIERFIKPERLPVSYQVLHAHLEHTVRDQAALIAHLREQVADLTNRIVRRQETEAQTVREFWPRQDRSLRMERVKFNLVGEPV